MIDFINLDWADREAVTKALLQMKEELENNRLQVATKFKRIKPEAVISDGNRIRVRDGYEDEVYRITATFDYLNKSVKDIEKLLKDESLFGLDDFLDELNSDSKEFVAQYV